MKKTQTSSEKRYSAKHINKTQAEARIALCKEALSQPRLVSRLKACYRSEEEVDDWRKPVFTSAEDFTRHSKGIELELGWPGTFEKYELSPCLEGAIYPFMRYRGYSTRFPIDSGFIWIGNKHCFPRIWVDNGFSAWQEPYDKNGIVQTFPFLPASELQDQLDRLGKRLRK